jgi:hypothetical protein
MTWRNRGTGLGTKHNRVNVGLDDLARSGAVGSETLTLGDGDSSFGIEKISSSYGDWKEMENLHEDQEKLWRNSSCQ